MFGPMVQWLLYLIFTAVARVRIPVGAMKFHNDYRYTEVPSINPICHTYEVDLFNYWDLVPPHPPVTHSTTPPPPLPFGRG